jgi:hypothetical protein
LFCSYLPLYFEGADRLASRTPEAPPASVRLPLVRGTVPPMIDQSEIKLPEINTGVLRPVIQNIQGHKDRDNMPDAAMAIMDGFLIAIINLLQREGLELSSIDNLMGRDLLIAVDDLIEQRRSDPELQDHVASFMMAKDCCVALGNVQSILEGSSCYCGEGDTRDSALIFWAASIGQLFAALTQAVPGGHFEHYAELFYRNEVRQQTLRSGAKMTNKSKIESADKWRVPALTLAKKERQKKPSASQTTLAEKIELNVCDVPSREAIIAQLRKWEKGGQLPRSTRNPNR